MRALVVDLGTTSIRTALVEESGEVTAVHRAALTVTSAQPGEVELDGDEIARAALALAAASLAEGGPADCVGITNQRASTVLFDAESLEPVGPVLGWQDLRTVIDCLVLQGSGLRLAPNQSATKAQWLLQRATGDRSRLRIGTLDTYLAAVLSRGELFVTDHSNAAITGLVGLRARGWDDAVLATLGLERSMLASLVNTAGAVGPATALDGAPPITALVGDQQASLFGQSCVTAGAAKITFGTGAMLDLVDGSHGPEDFQRYQSGCFPIVARSRSDQLTWGVEAIVLSAGSCIEWLKDSLGLISDPGDTAELATSVSGTDGVSFVPALAGLGTPQWDFGARGAFFGLTRGSSKAHLVRAVLEGIAQRGADLVEAAEAQVGGPIESIRVDGGMVRNRPFVQMLADACGRVVEVSSEIEATTRGAGLMALVGAGHLAESDVETMWRASAHVEPSVPEDLRDASRAMWRDVVRRAERTIPDLSNVSF